MYFIYDNVLLFTARYFSLTFYKFFLIVYLSNKNEKERPRPKFRSFSHTESRIAWLPTNDKKIYSTLQAKFYR